MKNINSTINSEFCDRLSNLYPSKTCSTIMASFDIKRPTTLRVNSLHFDKKGMERLFITNKISYSHVSWYADAYIVFNCTVRQLTELPGYTEGKFYIQNLSSMIPPLLLKPAYHSSVLDITAAPGSKTSQIAAMMGNTGEIVANDISKLRLLRLSANLKMLGISNVKVTNYPAQQIWKKYPEYFDYVLADVPCSMEGRINFHDRKSYENWSMSRIRALSDQQKWILRSAISAAKPGGIIVYSTCTLAPEENEAVIDWILTKEKNNIHLEYCSLPLLPSNCGITKWKNKQFNPQIARCMRIIPDGNMEGFFIALIRKDARTVSHSINLNDYE